MRDLFAKESFQLSTGAVASGISSRLHILRLKTGCAWITIEGDPHDYWLSAGDTLTVSPGRLVVVEAQRSGLQAQTRMETAPVNAMPCSTLAAARTLLARLAPAASARKTCAHAACGA